MAVQRDTETDIWDTPGQICLSYNDSEQPGWQSCGVGVWVAAAVGCGARVRVKSGFRWSGSKLQLGNGTVKARARARARARAGLWFGGLGGKKGWGWR